MKKLFTHQQGLIFCVWGLLLTHVQAQNSTDTTKHLEEIVVSSSGSEIKRKEAVSIVSLINAQLFEKTNSLTLSSGLNFQAGVRTENNCQNCGFMQVRINGLEGPYTQILIDSRAIFSSLTSVYGLEQIPANMIERVEVIKGGISSLFGSNAVAGAINIITKEPKKNLFQLSNTLTVIGNQSTDNTTFLNGSFSLDEGKLGVYIFGNSRKRNPYFHDTDAFSEIGKIESQTLGFKTFYKPNDQIKITLEYHNIHEFRRGGNAFDKPPHQTDITEQTDMLINGGGIQCDWLSKNRKQKLLLYNSSQSNQRKSYYGTDYNDNAYGHTEDFINVSGIRYTHHLGPVFLLPTTISVGYENQYNKMEDEIAGYNRNINQTTKINAAFIQNEWNSEHWSILVGGRLDKHNLIAHPIFTPRISSRLSITDNFILRAGYSTGFRAPQTFDEDLHILAVGGEVAIIKLSPNLKPEYSNSFSFSTDIYKSFGRIKTNWLIELFYTQIKDVFYLENVDTDANGNLIKQRQNGDGAVVKGINLEGKVIVNTQWQLQAGYTYQTSNYTKAISWSEDKNLNPQKKMFRAPNQYGYCALFFQPTSSLNINLSGNYTGTMLVQHFAGYIEKDTEKNTLHFLEIHFKAAYTFKITKDARFQINGGVQNIFNSFQNDFDQGKLRDAGYIYGPSLPQSVFIGGKVML